MDATTKPTRESIRALLERSDAAVEEALLRLHARQTLDEKESKDAKYRNNRGFNGRDARTGSKYAEWIIGMRRDHKATPGNALRRADHKAKAREIALRYVRQLLEEATEKWNAKHAVVDEAAMDAMVAVADIEDARRAAAAKARRDANLMASQPAHAPGTTVVTSLKWGYQTIAGLERSGTSVGDMQRIEIRPDGQATVTGLVIEASHNADGTPVNRVLFAACAAWVAALNIKAL